MGRRDTLQNHKPTCHRCLLYRFKSRRKWIYNYSIYLWHISIPISIKWSLVCMSFLHIQPSILHIEYLWHVSSLDQASLFDSTFYQLQDGYMCQGRSTPIGDGHPTFNRKPLYDGYINHYYWVDDHPLLYGNNGSLNLSTHQDIQQCIRRYQSALETRITNLALRSMLQTTEKAARKHHVLWCFPTKHQKIGHLSIVWPNYLISPT